MISRFDETRQGLDRVVRAAFAAAAARACCPMPSPPPMWWKFPPIPKTAIFPPMPPW